jgi:hypothetical protein
VEQADGFVRADRAALQVALLYLYLFSASRLARLWTAVGG